MFGVARFGETGLWAVPAVMLVACGLFLAVPDDDGLPSSAVPYTETKLVPEVSHVFSSSDTVESRLESAEYAQQGIVTSNDAKTTAAQNVVVYPAAFANMHDVMYTRYLLPYGDICVFDDEGNLYGGSENYVFRADVSEGAVTKWIIPHDSTFYGCEDTDSAGRFYFTTGANNLITDFNTLLRLNPANNSFTNYGLATRSAIVDSGDDVYMHQLGYTYVLEGSRDTKVFVSHLGISVDYDPDDEWHQCNVRCFDVQDTCDNACEDAQRSCEQACDNSQQCLDACNTTESQCEDACADERFGCEDACYAGPGRIDENDSVYNVVQFLGSGVSGPATVSVLSSDSSVLGTASVLPDRRGIVFAEVRVPVDVTSGTFDRESHTWDIPPGPYSTTGRHTLVLEDLSQTASTEFELDPNRIITPAPSPLEQHSGGTYFHRALVAKLDTDTNRLTTFYGNISDSGYSVIALDPSGRLYLEGDNYIARFDPVSNELKEWYVGSADAITQYGAYDKKVYYVESLQHRTMLAELDMEENTLRKWTMPHHRSPSSIAVDGQGDVFLAFYFSSWLKFVPSTGTFTEFGDPDPYHFEIGPQDVLYWAQTDRGGIIR